MTSNHRRSLFISGITISKKTGKREPLAADEILVRSILTQATTQTIVRGDRDLPLESDVLTESRATITAPQTRYCPNGNSATDFDSAGVRIGFVFKKLQPSQGQQISELLRTSQFVGSSPPEKADESRGIL